MLDELARGGQGAVYRALAADGRAVALKLLHPERAQSASARERFLREARALTRLDHPNVVEVLGTGEHEGAAWLALEFVEGETLHDRLARGALAVPEAIALTRQLAAALAHAHAAGVLHRDLKPDNVLLRGEQALLTDFGLALEEEGTRLTRTGMFVGTPGYWSPEQAQGETQLFSPATDVYGLGAVLYHALTGRPPIVARSLQDYLQSVEFQRIESPRRLRPDVPDWLSTLCMRCLSFAAGARPQTADAVLRALAAESSRAPGEPEPSEPKPSEPNPGEPKPPAPPALNPKLLIALAAVMLFTTLGLGAGVLSLRASIDEVREEIAAANAAAVEPRLADDDPGGDRAGVTAPASDPPPAVEEAQPPAVEEAQPPAVEEAQPPAVEPPPDPGPAAPDPDALAAEVERGIQLAFAGNFAGAVDAFDGVLARDPDHSEALYSRAMCRAQLHDPAAALPDYTRVIRLDPSDAEAYQGRGKALAKLGRHPEAIADLDRALALGVSTPQVSFEARGASHYELGNHAEALADLAQAVALAPQNVRLRLDRALLLVHHERYEEALADYGHALGLRPDDPRALADRAACLRKLGRYPEAIADLDRALTLRPDTRDWLRARGFCHYQLAQFAEAQRDLARVVELDPSDTWARSDLALSLLRLRRLEDALEQAQLVVDAAPDNATALSCRGMILRALGRHEPALADLARSVELKPSSALLRAELGAALVALERYAEALPELERALSGELTPTVRAKTEALREQASQRR